MTQTKRLLKLAEQWADNMRTGVITRDEAWLAINSTLWKTKTYPLNALNLSKQQCQAIMAPILNYGLPTIGVCCNFPRKIVITSTEYLGLGLQHTHTTQKILCTKDILNHTLQCSTTGQLYRTSIELFFIEAGMGTSFLHIPKCTNNLIAPS